MFSVNGPLHKTIQRLKRNCTVSCKKLSYPVCICPSVSIITTVITGRNEVVAKVMFLQVCVCPQGGGCLPQCMLGCHTLPPRDQADPPPPDQAKPPQTRQTPPPDQADPPRDQAEPPPPGKQTPAYGLRAAGTHPTGMHSC